MNTFDPSSMSDSTSPTVRSLRTFVERSIESEIEKAVNDYGEDIALLIEKSLRSLAFSIFHKNPKVHVLVKQNMFAFDEAIETLFAISGEVDEVKEEK
jgi:hypothetical protein